MSARLRDRAFQRARNAGTRFNASARAAGSSAVAAPAAVRPKASRRRLDRRFGWSKSWCAPGDVQVDLGAARAPTPSAGRHGPRPGRAGAAEHSPRRRQPDERHSERKSGPSLHRHPRAHRPPRRSAFDQPTARCGPPSPTAASAASRARSRIRHPLALRPHRPPANPHWLPSPREWYRGRDTTKLSLASRCASGVIARADDAAAGRSGYPDHGLERAFALEQTCSLQPATIPQRNLRRPTQIACGVRTTGRNGHDGHGAGRAKGAKAGRHIRRSQLITASEAIMSCKPIGSACNRRETGFVRAEQLTILPTNTRMARTFPADGSFQVLNRYDRPSPAAGEAEVKFLDGDFRIVRPGACVRCAVTGVPIPIEELKYWSVDLQEASTSRKRSRNAATRTRQWPSARLPPAAGHAARSQPDVVSLTAGCGRCPQAPRDPIALPRQPHPVLFRRHRHEPGHARRVLIRSSASPRR